MSLDRTINNVSVDESMFEQSVTIQQASIEKDQKETNVHQLYTGLIQNDLENTR